jgi:integrase/recombinase XerD
MPWGQSPFHTPERRELRVAEWPATDRAAWRVALQEGGFLEAAGPASRWSPDTRRRVERGYGAFLTWLTREQRLDPGGDPASRITRENVEAFTKAQLALNAARSVITRLDALALFVRAIGLEGDYTYLAHLQRQLRFQVSDGRGKAQRLRHAADLLELGLELMRSALEARGRVRKAIRYRDGLLIAFLSMRPLRMRNLLALTLDRHVVRIADRWWIMIDASETKNRRRIEFSVPPVLQPFLATYLDELRPVLARRAPRVTSDSGRLWLAFNGRPLTEEGLRAAIVARTSAAFGRPITPHLFRDAVATTIALEDPEHVRVAAQILGHASFATTERFYRMSRMVEAARSYDEIVDQLRSQAGKR